jgi:hypothetical protein
MAWGLVMVKKKRENRPNISVGSVQLVRRRTTMMLSAVGSRAAASGEHTTALVPLKKLVMRIHRLGLPPTVPSRAIYTMTPWRTTCLSAFLVLLGVIAVVEDEGGKGPLLFEKVMEERNLCPRFQIKVN